MTTTEIAADSGAGTNRTGIYLACHSGARSASPE
jgi:hypothetical protein